MKKEYKRDILDHKILCVIFISTALQRCRDLRRQPFQWQETEPMQISHSRVQELSCSCSQPCSTTLWTAHNQKKKTVNLKPMSTLWTSVTRQTPVIIWHLPKTLRLLIRLNSLDEKHWNKTGSRWSWAPERNLLMSNSRSSPNSD